jgi:toxin ParE1/3/4|tara:strand:- start:3000 stop:3293 length:294 start_codon:yes stop_codon:yes gene_type:complete
MAKYILSPQAQRNLKDIRAYTLKNFGKQQTRAYLKILQTHMKALAATPSKGKKRDEIKTDYYSSFIGSHTIYYRIAHTHIDIFDALHQSMEPMRHFT